MLFDSSLRRELWRGFVGTLVVLITVVLTMILIRLLGLAAKGSVAVADVSLLLGYTLMNQAPVLISLSLFVAVVAMLNRMQRESEMVVWQASGVRMWRLLKPLWQMSWPVIAALGLLVLVVRPWSQQQTQVIRDRFERRSDISRVAPGQFQTSANGKRVFFIDSHSDGLRTGKNVFMVVNERQIEAVITAREGQVETVDGQRFLLLKHGQRIETRLATGEKARSVFETARILVGDAPSEETTTDLARNRPTWALLDSSESTDRAELVWRVGTVWAALNLVLVALVSKSDQVRRANAWTLVWALLVFVVYFNLQSLAQSWVGSGKIGDRAGLFGLHGGVMLLALLALWWRDGGWRQSRPVKGQT